jgi:hypothetical protein
MNRPSKRILPGLAIALGVALAAGPGCSGETARGAGTIHVEKRARVTAPPAKSTARQARIPGAR